MAKNLAAALLTLLLAACGASLEDFSASELKLELDRSGQLRLTLGDAKGGCPMIGEDIRATLNGVTMQVESRGGQISSGRGWRCESPRFVLDRSALVGTGPDAHARIDDGDVQIALDAQNLLAERELTPARFDEGAAHKVTLKWVPETDLGRTAVWQLDRSGDVAFGQALVEQDQLSLELPEATGTLRVYGEASVPLARCESVGRCTVRVAVTLDDVALGR